MKNLPKLKKSPQNKKKSKGSLGENIAAKYLKRQGYKIIDRNFIKRGGEIDLIAIKDKTLVFIEVKTRWSKKFGIPEESVTPWKLKTLIRTACYYKLLHPELPDALRLDVVAVEMDTNGKPLEIRHTENVTG